MKVSHQSKRLRRQAQQNWDECGEFGICWLVVIAGVAVWCLARWSGLIDYLQAVLHRHGI